MSAGDGRAERRRTHESRYPPIVQRARSPSSFVDDPIDRWVVAGKTLIWCRHPALAGGIAWGRATPDETRETTRVFEGLFGPKMAEKVDLVLDARLIDAVDAEALAVLLAWLVDKREAITGRVRAQIGVIPEGMLGVTLAGILPAIGKEFHPVTIERDARAALEKMTSPEEAEDVSRVLDEALAEAMSASPMLRRLRALARERCADLSLEEAARALGVSTRTLQRSLRAEDKTFQDELKAARLARAKELLETSDEKIASIASRVGVSEGTLTELVRAGFGVTPAELRRRAR